MNVPPPPPSFEPSHANPSHRRAPWIVLGVCLILFIACAGLLVYGAGKVQQMAKEDPKPMGGYGKPKVVKPLKHGWATYRFDDLKLTVDLPAKPVPSKPNWDPAARVFVQEWAFYEVDSGFLSLIVDATVYKLGIRFTPREEAEMFLDEVKGLTGVKEVKEETDKAMVAGKDAHHQILRYQLEDEPAVNDSYCFSDGKRNVNFRFAYHGDLAEESRKDIDRILKSVRLVSP